VQIGRSLPFFCRFGCAYFGSDTATTPPDGYTEIFPVEALILLDPVPPAFLLEQSRLFFRVGLEPFEPGVAGERDEEDGYEEEFLAAAVVS
jgi:hypothetical protein